MIEPTDLKCNYCGKFIADDPDEAKKEFATEEDAAAYFDKRMIAATKATGCTGYPDPPVGSFGRYWMTNVLFSDGRTAWIDENGTTVVSESDPPRRS